MSHAYGDDEEVGRVLAHLAGRGYDVARVVGISLGGCCDAFGTERVGAMRRRAHAHTSKYDAMRGWICFKSANPDRFRTASGRPTTLTIHEVGHIVTWAGHTGRWIAAVTALGAPAEAKKYEVRNAERRARPPAVWYWPDPVTGVLQTGSHREMVEAKR